MTLRGNQTGGSATEFAAAVKNLRTALLPLTWEGLTIAYDGVVETLSNTDEALEDLTNVAAVSGAGTGNQQPVPFAIQGNVTLRTAETASGPSGRPRLIKGRINVPGGMQTQQSLGLWGSAYTTSLLTAFNAFDAAADMVVYSPTGAQVADVTSIIVPARPSVLRSRGY